MTTDPAEHAILGLLAAGARSISPEDAARALSAEDWRGCLTRIRQAALRLARAGRIEILRKGKPVGPEAARGVIRLRAAP